MAKKFITEIDRSMIKGYRIFLDVDGTLTPDGVTTFSQDVLDVVRELGAQNEVIISSNKPLLERNAEIATIAGGISVTPKVLKPSPALLTQLPPTDRPILVIGDKITTDGFFAKNINAPFLQVKRFVNGKEPLRVCLTNLYDNILSVLQYRSVTHFE